MDLQASLNAAKCARLAYKNDWIAGGRHYGQGNAHAVVYVDEQGGQWVAVEGTDEAADWLDNADSDLVELFGGVVAHKGFERHMRQLQELLNDLDKSKPVTFCGHSLGGAVAVLLADRWLNTYGVRSSKPTRVITFGSPRVFARGKSPRNVEVERWVIQGDPVPLLPSRRVFGHIGPLNVLGEDGVITHERDTWWRRLLNAVREVLEHWDVLRAIKANHSAIEYERRLALAVENYGG